HRGVEGVVHPRELGLGIEVVLALHETDADHGEHGEQEHELVGPVLAAPHDDVAIELEQVGRPQHDGERHHDDHRVLEEVPRLRDEGMRNEEIEQHHEPDPGGEQKGHLSLHSASSLPYCVANHFLNGDSSTDTAVVGWRSWYVVSIAPPSKRRKMMTTFM